LTGGFRKHLRLDRGEWLYPESNLLSSRVKEEL
jgi:hypothetical protein